MSLSYYLFINPPTLPPTPSAALFHLVWSQGPDVHDDVQVVAERSAGQGEWLRSQKKTWLRTMFPGLSDFILTAAFHPQPLCPKELWHFVHQCYGNELGLTSDDEDYVPPDDDFNTMG